MQLENTPTQWDSVVADLAAKRQSTESRLKELRAEKRSLALDAAMGSDDARKRLSKINTDLNRLALEIDEIEMALQGATSEKENADSAASVAAEAERQEQIREALRSYLEEVRNIDDALRLVAAARTAERYALSYKLR